MKPSKKQRRNRAGEGLTGHPLASLGVPSLVVNVSKAMLEALRALAETGDYLRDGRWCSDRYIEPITVEGLVKRDLAVAVWANFPHRAPLRVKLDSLTINDRGRATLAAWELTYPTKVLRASDVEVTVGGQMIGRMPASSIRSGAAIVLPTETSLDRVANPRRTFVINAKASSDALDILKRFQVEAFDGKKKRR